MQPPRPGSGLALVGYRGTGKSTVGRLLAGTMKRKFLDVDLEIEARAGRSIAAIFCESGEPAFREWEERTMAVLFEQYPEAVVATGGGARFARGKPAPDPSVRAYCVAHGRRP